MPPEAAAAAPAAPAPAAATPTPAAAAVAPASAALSSVPSPEWASGFKDDLKPVVARFKSAEDLAISYQNLEKLKGVPEDRLLKLPEKMEGDEARAIWERLGAPKEPKGYEIPRDEKSPDRGFADWAEGAFHKNNLTKSQAAGVAQMYQERIKSEIQAQTDATKSRLAQADQTLKKEWGQHYEANINIAKQGVKVLGLDAKTLDLLEAVQGRDVLFKNLQRLGASVGESSFVDGTAAPATAMTAEQAQEQIKIKTADEKFRKKLLRGDAETVAEWNKINMLAAPGEKPIG